MKAILKEALKTAMKNKDRLRMETIRSLLSEIQYEEMNKSVDELPASDTVVILQREMKKRQEAIGFEEQANRQEEKAKLQNEMAIIETFLPRQMGADDIERVLTEFKTTTPGAALNGAMKFLKENYAGQYDGKSASEIAKRVLG
ncbi:MAG: hypothetical protein RL326_1517 [Pseudomonadota bacterium]|jgi:uncharacterized protein YqeY